MTPAWAMNPLMWPTFPPIRIVPPFSEIPARDDASPSMTIVPPRLDAPAHSETLPWTRTDPACRFSPTDQPVKPCTTTSGPSPRPPMKYPALPSMSIRTRLLRPTARLWRPLGSSTRADAPSGSAASAALISRVDSSAQLKITGSIREPPRASARRPGRR